VRVENRGTYPLDDQTIALVNLGRVDILDLKTPDIEPLPGDDGQRTAGVRRRPLGRAGRHERQAPLLYNEGMTSEPQKQRLGVRAGYDLWAATYDRDDNALRALDTRHALRTLDPQPGELVLDAGCGSGRYLGAIAAAGATAVGADFSLSMLRRARNTACHLAAADLQGGLPFREQAFDAALCSPVGEHLEALVPALTELRRVLKPAGRMVFSVLHPDQVAAGIEASVRVAGIEYGLGAERHSVQDYLDAVMDAGFGDVAFASFRGGADAGKFAGQPLLFLMAATASSTAEESER
jgi:SAM-dependent methyltransferase